MGYLKESREVTMDVKAKERRMAVRRAQGKCSASMAAQASYLHPFSACTLSMAQLSSHKRPHRAHPADYAPSQQGWSCMYVDEDSQNLQR